MLQIKVDEEDPLFLTLLWENEVWKKVYKYLFFRKLKPLFSAKTLKDAEVLFEEIEEKVAKPFAIKCLSKKALLESELAQKMKEKGISSKTSMKVIAFCRDFGVLSDQQTLENRVERELRRGKGLMYAKAKWQRSGDIEWGSTEKRELEKKAALAIVQKYKKKPDLFLFLRRRGFRSEIIQEVLNQKEE